MDFRKTILNKMATYYAIDYTNSEYRQRKFF